MAEPNVLPLELTAPLIQRLARKGAREQLDAAECATLCECILLHVDAILEHRRAPKIGVEPPVIARSRSASRDR